MGKKFCKIFTSLEREHKKERGKDPMVRKKEKVKEKKMKKKKRVDWGK